MFTGIVEEVGKIQNITSNTVTIACKIVLEDVKIGDSIAVNGVCLTVVKLLSDGFVADISSETIRVTAPLKCGDSVNLERAMKADGRFGGHIVSGHIDGRGKLLKVVKDGNFYDLQIELPDETAKYTIKKGSIAVNGISLTIAGVNGNIINAAIIPHTFENTNLKYLNSGSFVNIEADMIARYVEKFLSTSDNRGVNIDFLQENGFI